MEFCTSLDKRTYYDDVYCWLLWVDPSSDLVRSNKIPKGYRPTRQQAAKQPEVSPEVTMGGVQTQVSTLTEIKNVLLRLSYTHKEPEAH